MKRKLSLFVGALALLASSSGAFACQGDNVLFEDDFSFADPAWGSYSDVQIANGVLTLLPAENGGSTLQNQSGFMEGNVDICVDVVQKVPDPSVSYAGLIFGAIDYDNYYVFQVSTNGYVNVVRAQKGRWLTPVPWTLTEGVVKAGTEVNQLRLVTNASMVTGYVNGKQVIQFRAQLPKDGMLIGFYGGASKGKSTFDFDNLKVTEATEAPAVASAPAPPAASAPPSAANLSADPSSNTAAEGSIKAQPGIPKMP